MATTQQDKPSAKQRQRARKAEQKAERRERQTQPAADQVNQDQMADAKAPENVTAPDIAAPIEAAAVVSVAEETAADEIEQATIDVADETAASEIALRGEVIPPQSHAIETAQPVNAIAFQTIAEAYADYARNSWDARRVLVDRVMTTRSFSEAMEAHGDFARQAYANFVVHSQRIGELYADFTRQFFRPLEMLATGWTRLGR